MSDSKSNRQQLACNYIREHYVARNRIRFDVITQKVQIRDAVYLSLENGNYPKDATDSQQQGKYEKWRYITNADINTMVCDACTETDANITSKEILTVLNAGATYIPHIHPLREYIHNLSDYIPEKEPDWIDLVAKQVRVVDSNAIDRREAAEDGRSAMPVDRPAGCSITRESTASSASDLNSADRFWRMCFKKWFVAMVASWIKDEVVNHQVLVLIGKQGIYKTTWLERLIPQHLRDYCCKLANATQLSKDDRLRIAEFGLINLDELDALTPRELNAMKSVITASDVNERVAYGYTKERRVRLASFCASSNKREFLTDITGNRRWLPFEVETIQNPFDTIILYDRLYAQARYLVQYGFNYWFDLDDINRIEEHNDAFRAQESEEQLLPILFDVPAEGFGEFMTTAQISERLVSYGNIKKPIAVSHLGMLLSKSGYKSVTRGSRNARVRGWIVYQRDSSEIEANRKLYAK